MIFSRKLLISKIFSLFFLFGCLESFFDFEINGKLISPSQNSYLNIDERVSVHLTFDKFMGIPYQSSLFLDNQFGSIFVMFNALPFLTIKLDVYLEEESNKVIIKDKIGNKWSYNLNF